MTGVWDAETGWMKELDAEMIYVKVAARDGGRAVKETRGRQQLINKMRHKEMEDQLELQITVYMSYGEEYKA